MSDSRESVVREAEPLPYRCGRDLHTVEPSGVQNAVGDTTVDEIATALDELAVRGNGSA